MSLSVLRTADAWWVSVPSGAAKVTTTATTTGELLADRPALDAAGTGHADGRPWTASTWCPR